MVWREASKERRERDTAVSGERVDVQLWRFGGMKAFMPTYRRAGMEVCKSGNLEV